MKTYLCIPLLLVSLTLTIRPIHAQTTDDDYLQQWVNYKDGALSLTFDHTPLNFALSALHAKTGVQIIMPTATETRLLNLRVDHEPLEPAVRSLIRMMGYGNFALLYDDNGRPSRAIVVNTKPVVQPVNTPPKAEAAQTLSKEERDRLQNDLERWDNLKQEDRGRIEDRLKNLSESPEREELVRLYGRQVLGISKAD